MRNQFGKNKRLPPLRTFPGLVMGVLFLGLSATFPATLVAQQIFDPAASEADLPNSPGWESPSPQSPITQSTASISGYVFDINGGIVPSAKITLIDLSGGAERVET